MPRFFSTCMHSSEGASAFSDISTTPCQDTHCAVITGWTLGVATFAVGGPYLTSLFVEQQVPSIIAWTTGIGSVGLGLINAAYLVGAIRRFVADLNTEKTGSFSHRDGADSATSQSLSVIP